MLSVAFGLAAQGLVGGLACTLTNSGAGLLEGVVSENEPDFRSDRSYLLATAATSHPPISGASSFARSPRATRRIRFLVERRGADPYPTVLRRRRLRTRSSP